jgi:hypothetical protein
MPNSPCLFAGNLIDCGPPIYVGIYVDDIIYFSPSDDVERKLEASIYQVLVRWTLWEKSLIFLALSSLGLLLLMTMFVLILHNNAL